ncbi:MAG: cytochrome c family protein [Woeseiaceae bacterium]|nr:cytochrome c family protein [Woeseiaceae bacterium]
MLAAVAVAVMISGCGQQSDDSGTESVSDPILTAETLGEQVVLSADQYLAAPPYAGADRTQGERQAQICRACHSLDRGGPHMVGPGLHEFFGTTAGTREGFAYSEALRESDFVWTPRALDAWLAQPGRFLPGNKMTFAGVMRQEDRDALIAYLLDVTTAE